jgi:gas vesicle protein
MKLKFPKKGQILNMKDVQSNFSIIEKEVNQIKETAEKTDKSFNVFVDDFETSNQNTTAEFESKIDEVNLSIDDLQDSIDNLPSVEGTKVDKYLQSEIKDLKNQIEKQKQFVDTSSYILVIIMTVLFIIGILL